MRSSGPRLWAAVAVAMMFTSGCSAAASDSHQEVVVSAAASLSDVFRDIEAAFEVAHPEFDVLLNLGGSAALREQILEGAPADVFAPANRDIMDQVADESEVVGTPVVFATNHMVLALPAGNPGGVVGLEDLARADLFVGLCAESVPCGMFAREVLSSAGIEPSIDTNEPDVRSLLLKIELGEIDVGIVYATDVLAAHGTVDWIGVPPEHDVEAEYPIAVLSGAPNPSGGEAFIRFVTSDQGAAILAEHGFNLP